MMRKNNLQLAQNPVPCIRCAIYTRKSTTEGLDMDFNTLDAQRDSCEAYIKSQAHEGWVALPEMYDDGGYTGGNMERPAFKLLMTEVEAGRVDCVVVYKVDRLSRSLMDFTKIMEKFEAHNVSFVSITQQFNTATSMGRLMMNVLLSFAQFERELVSERTRDKIAASRKKGKWAGGYPVLGYDIDHLTHRLMLNEEEAVQVHLIFELYLQLKTLRETVDELNLRGWKTKTWTTKNGKLNAGQPFNKNRLHRLLTNVAYIGKVPHKDAVYEGEHEGIIDDDLWGKVQTLLEFNWRTKGCRQKNKHGALLMGVVRCASCDCTMIHTFSNKKNKQYRYYTCSKAHNKGYKTCPTKCVSAPLIENAVVEQIRELGKAPEMIEKTILAVNEEHKKKIPTLQSEKKRIQNDLTHIQAEAKRLVAAISNGTGEASRIVSERLAEIEKEIEMKNQRLSALKGEMLQIDMKIVDQADVRKALVMFDPIWDVLYPKEKARVLHLLVEQVVYDGEQGTIAVTFNPMGMKTLAAEAVAAEMKNGGEHGNEQFTDND